MPMALMVAVLMHNYDCWLNCSPKMDDCLSSLVAFVFVDYLANVERMPVAMKTMDNLSSNNVT